MKTQFVFLMGIVCVLLLPTTIGAPVEDEGYNDNTEEDRSRRRRRRKRPCGRDASEDGRTFFDWSYSYLNVNHNYNVNCGGGGSGTGGGYIPSIRPGHHQGNRFGSHGFGNGLHGGNNFFGNKGGGLFGLGLFDWLQNNPSAQSINNNPINSANAPNSETAPNSDDNQDYDVVDDKPVSENYDDIPVGYQNIKPGQYVTAYNPLFGNYVQDVSNYKPSRIIKQVNKDIDKLFRPFYDLFR